MIFTKTKLEQDIPNTIWIIDGMIVISVKIKPFDFSQNEKDAKNLYD